MSRRNRPAVALGAVWLLVGCASGETVRTSDGEYHRDTDDVATTGTGASTVTLTTSISAGESDAETGASMGDSTGGFDTESADDTVGHDDTGDDETGGMVPDTPGQSGHQLVSAGVKATSESYIMVFTLGQPTKLPTLQTSEEHRMQGGLIGANGSPP